MTWPNLMNLRLSRLSNNVDGPKVNVTASLSKTWLYAGKSEYPTLLLERSDKVVGADHQQERLRSSSNTSERSEKDMRRAIIWIAIILFLVVVFWMISH